MAWRAAGPPAVLRGLAARRAPFHLPRVELFAGEVLDLVHVAEDAAEFVAERSAPLAEIGGRFEQMLIANHLARGREEQRRHGLVAAHLVLRDVLPADAQRFLRQVLLADLG